MNDNFDIKQRCKDIIQRLEKLDKNNPSSEYLALYDELQTLTAQAQTKIVGGTWLAGKGK